MDILQGFEKFKSPGGTYKLRISIRQRGQVGINSGIIKKFGLHGLEIPEYVVMYISQDRKKVGFQFTKDQKAEGAIKIVKRKGNYYFSGVSFFDCYGISYDETRTFDVESDVNNKIAVIDLEKPIEEKSRKQIET